MKRWDEVTLAVNLAQEGARYTNTVAESLRRTALANMQDGKPTPYSQYFLQTAEDIRRVNHYLHILKDAVVGTYPLTGIEGWMLEGEPDNLKFRYERAAEKEALILGALQKASEQLQALHARMDREAMYPAVNQEQSAVMALQQSSEVRYQSRVIQAVRALVCGAEVTREMLEEKVFEESAPPHLLAQIDNRLAAEEIALAEAAMLAEEQASTARAKAEKAAQAKAVKEAAAAARAAKKAKKP